MQFNQTNRQTDVSNDAIIRVTSDIFILYVKIYSNNYHAARNYSLQQNQKNSLKSSINISKQQNISQDDCEGTCTDRVAAMISKHEGLVSCIQKFIQI